MSWTQRVREVVDAGADVIILADGSAPLALAAAEAAGPQGSARVAAWSPEAEGDLGAALAGKATVFRAVPGDL